MQASQNTAQVFLGVNMKCNACHDSFVSRWKLKDAYGLAAFFSPEPKLQLYRCDVARDDTPSPLFLFPELERRPRVERARGSPRRGRGDLSPTRATAACRAPSSTASGSACSATASSPTPTRWTRAVEPGVARLAGQDFVDHGYDLKHLIATIMTSRAYQLPAVPRDGEPSARGYVFEGPEVRRLTAEQFADADRIDDRRMEHVARHGRPGGQPSHAKARRRCRLADRRRRTRANGARIDHADPRARPAHPRSGDLRPPDDATTPQALELVNGERLTQWLSRGARRCSGELPADAFSRFNGAIAGRRRSRRASISTSRVDGCGSWCATRVERAGE